ncbi:MAG: GNAT family N-acetyltransferase [Mobilitalea sp.]
MDIIIERACLEDAQKLIETRNISFYDDFINYGKCPAYNNTIESMERRIKIAYLYKILVDGEIIGDICIKKRGERYYWIAWFEVIPLFQNKGIGTKVFSFIMKEFPDADRWELDTPIQNPRNLHFYEKMGFVMVNDKIQSERLTLRHYRKTISEPTEISK